MDTEIKRVAVVIVNWEGWQDTAVCLESLDELTIRPSQAIVVDNGSSDASVEHLVDWLQRHGKIVFDHDGYGRNGGEVTKSRRSQPVPHATATPQARILPDDCGAEALVVGNGLGTRYVLLQLRTNRGFAAASNAGIRHLETSGQYIDYYWLLNNDTCADKNALARLLERGSHPDKVGIYGSVILDEREPYIVQALGGSSLWGLHGAGLSSRWAKRACTEVWNSADIERQLSYIYGVFMFVSHEFVVRVGLMCEDYFLYDEELDWALRGKARGFTLGLADSSIVCHKGGASFARVSRADRSNYVSGYDLVRGAVVTTWRRYPWALPSVLAMRWKELLVRLFRGQRLSARATALALLMPWRLLLPSDLRALVERRSADVQSLGPAMSVSYHCCALGH
jgi:GT2 family glycosyltransferase